MNDPSQMIQILTICTGINFSCSVLHWFRSNYKFSMVCATVGLFCVIVIAGLKHYGG